MAEILRLLPIIALGGIVAQLALYGSRAGVHALGKPTIWQPAFYLAKVSLTVSLCVLLWKAVMRGGELPLFWAFTYFLLLTGGTSLVTLGFCELGRNLRMGLPDEDTSLITGGVYRFSRNPIYLGLFLLMGASVIYAPSWVNLGAALASVGLHHWIVLAEERYLAARFDAYRSYRTSVHRYL
jgi:protein-S-isoprenylcysteine O-methyltransferase Ste14